MWIVGMLTSLLTATYMFRLVFLAFHGERRHDAPSAPDHGPRTTDHGHGAHLHDAPPAMAVALILLAIGSIAAGFIGVPHALGGGNRLEAFLEPSFEAHASAPATPEFQVGEGRPATRVELAAEKPAEAAPDESTELKLMGLSVTVAVLGILVASYFWLRNRTAAPKAARSAAPI